MKIPNSGLNVFLSGSTGRVYQLQDRSSCRMRYLHYPTLENSHSFIKRIAKRKKKRISLIPPPVTTAEIRPSRNFAEKNDKKWKFQILVSTCSWAAAQAGSTNCKIAVIVECDTFTDPTLENSHSFIKRIAKRKKKRISLIPPPVTTAEIRPSRNFAEKNEKMKIPNSGLNVFLSGSTGRVYQLQDRSSCRMRYLHYPTLENTRSVMKLRTNM